MHAVDGRTPLRQAVTDPGWATAWMDRFEPLPVGRRLLIVPPWNSNVVTRRLKLIINPGQAFGTGHHATTYGALATIEKLCAKRRFEHALDVGTGSGVLAIAMRLMGVGQVCAIDIDALALENARENAALNSPGGRIRFATTPLARLRRRFDLITANILSSTLDRDGERADQTASPPRSSNPRWNPQPRGGVGTQDLPSAPAMPQHTARPWLEHAGARAMKRAAKSPMRFAISSAAVEGAVALVGGGELHHMRDVMRLLPGAEVALFDERGAEYAGTIQSFRGASCGGRNRRGDSRACGNHRRTDPGRGGD